MFWIKHLKLLHIETRMTKDEALRLALESLEYHTAQTRPIHQTIEAITAIKEALAQPEQEQDGECKYCTDGCPACDARKLPAQRTWVGLTEDDRVLIKHDANFNQFMTAGEYADRVQQLTEARLKDLNT